MDALGRNIPPTSSGGSNSIDDEEFWPLRKVLKQVGIGRSKLYLMIAAGEFPSPVKIHARSFWRKSEIIAWKHDIIERTRAVGWKAGWMGPLKGKPGKK